MARWSWYTDEKRLTEQAAAESTTVRRATRELVAFTATRGRAGPGHTALSHQSSMTSCSSTRRGSGSGPTPLRGHGGRGHERSLRPGGHLAAGYGGVDVGDNVGGVVLLDARGERLRGRRSRSRRAGSPAWPSARGAPSPRDTRGNVNDRISGSSAAWCSSTPGGAAPADPLRGHGGRGHSVAFGPGGTLAAGYGRGDGGGVVLFDARGERLRPTPLEVPEGRVNSVAFGPGGTLAAGYAASAAAWCCSTRRGSGSGRRRSRSRRAGSRAWPSARGAPSPRDTAAAAAAWCSSTPGASGSGRRRWRSRGRGRQRGLRPGGHHRRA